MAFVLVALGACASLAADCAAAARAGAGRLERACAKGGATRRPGSSRRAWPSRRPIRWRCSARRRLRRRAATAGRRWTTTSSLLRSLAAGAAAAWADALAPVAAARVRELFDEIGPAEEARVAGVLRPTSWRGAVTLPWAARLDLARLAEEIARRAGDPGQAGARGGRRRVRAGADGRRAAGSAGAPGSAGAGAAVGARSRPLAHDRRVGLITSIWRRRWTAGPTRGCCAPPSRSATGVYQVIVDDPGEAGCRSTASRRRTARRTGTARGSRRPGCRSRPGGTSWRCGSPRPPARPD